MASIAIKPDATPDPTGTAPEGATHSTDGKTERVVVTPGEQKPAESQTPERPAWLPEKFATPEDLAKAYGELSKKLGEPKQPAEVPSTEAATKAVTDAGLDMAALNAEYAKDGKLSDETYSKLAEKGISREMTDAYIAGQKARADAYNAKLIDAVGGQEEFTSLLEWSATNLTDAEIAEANKALASGNESLAKLTLSGLQARYTAAMGTAPSLVEGEGTSRTSGVKPFASNAELTRAMSDPRYEEDEAYRQSVYKRLAVTDMFSVR